MLPWALTTYPDEGLAPERRLAVQETISAFLPSSPSGIGYQESPNVSNSSASADLISSSEYPVSSRNLTFQATNERRSKSTIALGSANSFKTAQHSCRFWVERSISN